MPAEAATSPATVEHARPAWALEVARGELVLRAPLAGLAFATCCAVWGSTWLAIKVGYAGMGALTGASLRFALAAALLLALMPLLRAPLPRGGAAWGLVAATGTLNFAAVYGLVYWGEQRIDSGLAAVLFAVFPMVTAVVGHVGAEERFTARKAGGIAVGIAGLGVVFSGNLRLDHATALPMAAIVLSAVAGAVGTLAARRRGRGLHPATYTAPAMAFGALQLGVAALLLGEPPALPVGAAAWASLLYLAVAGSVLAFLLYFWLVQQWGPGRTSLLTLLTPLVALALGAAVLGERPGPEALAGGALVLAGVAATLRAGAVPPAAR